MDSRRLHAHAHQRGKAASKIRDFGISLNRAVASRENFQDRINQKNEIRTRCEWARNELSIRYHDEEWGVPQHEDKKLFEFLILEGAQAGLSWDTILRKRQNYRRAFARFDPRAVARFGKKDVAVLMQDSGIVRNRLKIESAISNAAAFLAVQAEFGGF